MMSTLPLRQIALRVKALGQIFGGFYPKTLYYQPLKHDPTPHLEQVFRADLFN